MYKSVSSKFQLCRSGDKTKLYRDESRFPTLQRIKDEIAATRAGIRDHLVEVRRTLMQPKHDYVTVSGIEVNTKRIMELGMWLC